MEVLYDLCSENKGDDQLRSYCAADLRPIVFAYAIIWFSHNEAHLLNHFLKETMVNINN